MSEAERAVHQLLSYLEERIDPEHVDQAFRRRQAALDYRLIDRPPLIFYPPYEGTDVPAWPYRAAFCDPAAMMAHELQIGFTSLYHAVDLHDDAPYALRPNLGTTIIASQFGAEIRLVEDNPPWVMPLGSVERIRAIVDGPLPDPASGLAQRAMDQYDYYRTAVQGYPRCQVAFQFTLPDLQGPFSVAELLWGSGIYYALYDMPDPVARLLDRITEQIIRVYRRLAPLVTDSLGLGYCHQHGVSTRGTILVRDDSAINLSPALFRKHVLPHDVRLSQALGSIGLHYCGKGSHQLPNFLAIPALGCLDLGNPEMNDLDALYAMAATRQVALVRLRVPADELRSGSLARRFPTGVSLVHTPQSVQEAHSLLAQYLG